MSMSSRTLAQFKHVQRCLAQLQDDEPQALIFAGDSAPSGNVIIFTSSFNPITVAHLALLKQAHFLEREHPRTYLYAAFSKKVVDKEHVERPLLLDRLMLVKQVLRRRLPHCGLMVFNRGLYVEQAQAIRASFSRVHRIFFLIGYDKIVQILDPRYYHDRDQALHELFAVAELLVAPRGTAGKEALYTLLCQPQNRQYERSIHYLPFQSTYRDVSSTRVRQGYHSAISYVPQEVRSFMHRTRAYMPPIRYPDGRRVDVYGERMEMLRHVLGTPVF